MKNTKYPEISVDRDANAIYIKISDEKVDKTKEISNSIFADIDENENVVGIEILK